METEGLEQAVKRPENAHQTNSRAIKQHGGKRSGAGRKPNPTKLLKGVSRETLAQAVAGSRLAVNELHEVQRLSVFRDDASDSGERLLVHQPRGLGRVRVSIVQVGESIDEIIAAERVGCGVAAASVRGCAGCGHYRGADVRERRNQSERLARTISNHEVFAYSARKSVREVGFEHVNGGEHAVHVLECFAADDVVGRVLIRAEDRLSRSIEVNSTQRAAFTQHRRDVFNVAGDWNCGRLAVGTLDDGASIVVEGERRAAPERGKAQGKSH